MVEQKESSASYLTAKRQDLADKESSEATFISQFLPKAMTAEEVSFDFFPSFLRCPSSLVSFRF